MKFLKSFYLTSVFFITAWGIVLLFILSYFSANFIFIAKLLFWIFILTAIIDTVILFINKNGVDGKRKTSARFSNGDENQVFVSIENHYSFKVNLMVIDEIPHQFQIRDFKLKLKLNPGDLKTISYNLRPVKRGEYKFGNLNFYISSPLNLIRRKFIFDGNKTIPVYPSFVQMREYELLAISNRLTEVGVKKIRKIGRSTEFDQIRNYVTGDDYRTINWKATARKSELMVNHYVDEKSQQVYSVIDMGRIMKMPFDGMSLVDYAINSSLVISNIAIHKQDKAGIITFSNKVGTVLPAENRSTQMLKILDVLYNQESEFLESDYEKLCAEILAKVKHRSLIILYTNFETLDGLKRQLFYIKKLALYHLVVIIFFENTELFSLLESSPANTEQIYIKTIAEKFALDKRQIVKELEKNNIQSILTSPEKLSINTINKYLELKARGMI